MLTLVINLDRSPERMAHMEAQLSRLGVAYDRLQAVDGRTLDRDYVGKFPPMAASQVGCYLSHKAAWQRIADGTEPYGIVLEDDIHIAPAFADFARSSEWVPADAGIVKFETLNRLVALDRIPHSTWYGSALCRLRSVHPGTGGYLLSVEAARHLLTTRAAPREPADDAMFYVEEPWRHLPIVYQVDPAVCIQDMFVLSQPKDPRLASVQEIKRRRHKSLAHRTVREARRFYRWLMAGEASAAAAIGMRPRLIQKVVPFAGADARPYSADDCVDRPCESSDTVR
jgi:glycosyl transferase family 25